MPAAVATHTSTQRWSSKEPADARLTPPRREGHLCAPPLFRCSFPIRGIHNPGGIAMKSAVFSSIQLCFLVVSALLIVGIGQARAERYKVTDLGALPGGSDRSVSHGIN